MDEIMERDKDKIMKHSKIKDAEWILELHGIERPYGWEIAMGMVLSSCEEFIVVVGFGKKAVFEIH